MAIWVTTVDYGIYTVLLRLIQESLGNLSKCIRF